MSKLTNHHRERKDSKVRERACEREGLQQPAVYQREHLFFGFIGDSEGQLKAFENSGTFRRTPFTLENEEKNKILGIHIILETAKANEHLNANTYCLVFSTSRSMPLLFLRKFAV